MNFNQHFINYDTHNHSYYRVPDGTQLINDIQKAINAEYSAITCYEKLAKMAPTKDEKDKILEIQNDEKRHFEEFRNIY